VIFLWLRAFGDFAEMMRGGYSYGWVIILTGQLKRSVVDKTLIENN